MAIYYTIITIITAVSYFFIKKYLPVQNTIYVCLSSYILLCLFPLIITNLGPVATVIFYVLTSLLISFLIKKFTMVNSGNNTTEKNQHMDNQTQEKFDIADKNDVEDEQIINEPVHTEEEFNKEFNDKDIHEEDNNNETIEQEIPESFSYVGITRSVLAEPEQEQEEETEIIKVDNQIDEDESVLEKQQQVDVVEEQLELKETTEEIIENQLAFEEQADDELNITPANNLEIQNEQTEKNKINDQIDDVKPIEYEDKDIPDANENEAQTDIITDKDISPDEETPARVEPRQEVQQAAEQEIPKVTEEPIKLTAKELISRGLTNSRQGNYNQAIKLLLEALKQQPEPILKYVAVSELSTIYQQIGIYHLASNIITAYINQNDLKGHPGLKAWKEKVMFLANLTSVLKENKLPNLPYNRVPDFIKKKAFSMTLEKINK